MYSWITWFSPHGHLWNKKKFYWEEKIFPIDKRCQFTDTKVRPLGSENLPWYLVPISSQWSLCPSSLSSHINAQHIGSPDRPWTNHERCMIFFLSFMGCPIPSWLCGGGVAIYRIFSQIFQMAFCIHISTMIFAQLAVFVTTFFLSLSLVLFCPNLLYKRMRSRS